MLQKLLRCTSLNTDLSSLLLRLLVGCLMVHYGYAKYLNYDNILPQFKDFIGIGSQLSFNLVIFAELGCGLLISIGLLTRLAIVPVFITMWVAYFIAHANDAFNDKSPAFIFLVLSVIIFLLGSGKYSIDYFLWKGKSQSTDTKM